jgi:PAS domain S-box-containing protein
VKKNPAKPPAVWRLVYSSLKYWNAIVFVFFLLASAWLWQREVEQLLKTALFELESVVASMDKTIYNAINSMKMLKISAERSLLRKRELPPGFLEALQQRPNKFSADISFLSTSGDALPAYVFGKGTLSGTEERASEISGALLLTPLMVEMLRNMNNPGLAYYVSVSEFGVFYSVPPAKAPSVQWDREIFQRPAHLSVAPQKNPQRQIRWSDVYTDSLGAGKMISLSAPIYDPSGLYRAFVALDIPMKPLQNLLLEKQGGLGDYYVITETHQLLASSTHLKSSVPQVLPRALLDDPDAHAAFLHEKPAACTQKARLHICRLRAKGAPWGAILSIKNHILYLAALRNIWLEISGLLLLAFLLLMSARQKRLEARLRVNDAHYQRILGSSDQGFWEWHVKTRAFSASPRFDLILGYPYQTSPLRLDWRKVTHPDDVVNVRNFILACSRGRQPLRKIQFRAKTKHGQWRWLAAQGKIVETDRHNQPHIVAGSITDITEAQTNTKKLLISRKAAENARREAELANAAKSQFLTAASHDLRQPLQAILLFASALQKNSSTAEREKIARQLLFSAQALSDILNSLLNLSRLERGVMIPHLSLVEIYEIFQRIENEFSSIALKKELRFKLFFPKRPLLFYTDADMLMGILRNLISNAIRYTDWGGVLIGVRTSKSHLRFQVWDTGIGIKEEEMPRIYEEFYQTDNPSRNQEQGLGLGLSIARHMSKLLGCNLDCHSRYGRGTLFELLVPVENPPRTTN